jgi:FKBP-type peptidyl-prolyl cis-trans isomerase 2
VQKSRIEGLDELSVGDHVNLLPKGGREVSGWIESFEESEVVINRNHRLAGEDLDVEIELLSVQDS